MKLSIIGQKAEWTETHLTVYGSEGIYELEVEFADDPNVGASWDDLAKKAVYKNSALESTYPDGIYADIVDGVAQVPAAILSAPGLLYVGVMGEAAGVAMPTVWASPLAISPGCGEGQDAPPVVYDAARNAIKYGENAEVYADGGYLVLEVEGTLDDPVLVRSDEHTDGAKDYADAAALSSNFASARAKDAEAYAIGSRDGEPVTSDDPAYHNNAMYYAGQAANSASDAHADAVAAHDDAVNAHADAQAAAGSASDASGYATAAGNAKTAAQSAQGYAEAAQTGAETAEGNAEAWSVGQRDGVDVPATDPAYNNNAKYYAGQAAASAAQAAQTAASIAADFAYLTAPDGISQVGLYQDREATPGAIVVFDDGAAVPAKSATIAIEPVQDKHGYEHPWPAGGGKNKINDTKKVYSSNTVFLGVDSTANPSCVLPAGTYTFWVELASGTTTNLYAVDTATSDYVPGFPAYGVSGKTFTLSAETSIQFRVYDSAATSADFVARAQVEAGSAKTSYSPYANICPIAGHTAAAVGVAGKNLLSTGTDISNGYIAGSYLKADGTTAANAGYNVSEYIRVAPNTSYVFSTEANANAPSVCAYDAFFNFLAGWNFAGGKTIAFTTPSNAVFVRCSVDVIRTNQLEAGTVATAYEPYAGSTIAVDWTAEAGTVYGGTLEYLGGQMWRLTVDRAGHDIGGILSMTYNNNGYFLIYKGGIVPAAKTGTGNTLLCSILSQASAGSGNYYVYETNGQIRLVDTDYNNADNFRAAMAGQYLIYPLATPQVYDLTADELITLFGNNVIFADTGDIEELTYRTSENSRTIVLGTNLSGALEAIAGFIGVGA